MHRLQPSRPHDWYLMSKLSMEVDSLPSKCRDVSSPTRARSEQYLRIQSILYSVHIDTAIYSWMWRLCGMRVIGFTLPDICGPKTLFLHRRWVRSPRQRFRYSAIKRVPPVSFLERSVANLWGIERSRKFIWLFWAISLCDPLVRSRSSFACGIFIYGNNVGFFNRRFSVLRFAHPQPPFEGLKLELEHSDSPLQPIWNIAVDVRY